MATFRLFGDDSDLTARAVTERLSVTPSRSFEAGERTGSRSANVRAAAGWLLTSAPTSEAAVELADHIERLLALLEPVTAELWDLVRIGYTANWFCYIESDPLEHAVELDRGLLSRVLQLPGDIWLDVSAT